MSGNSVYLGNPNLKRSDVQQNWTKQNVKEYLFSQAYRTVAGMKAVGKFRQEEYNRQHKTAGAHPLIQDGQLHRGLSPDDILLVIGGGDAGGHSSFIPSWSRTRSSLMQSKPIGVCIDCD